MLILGIVQNSPFSAMLAAVCLAGTRVLRERFKPGTTRKKVYMAVFMLFCEVLSLFHRELLLLACCRNSSSLMPGIVVYSLHSGRMSMRV